MNAPVDHIKLLHEAELSVEADLRTVRGTTADDVQGALETLKSTAREIVNLARSAPHLRVQDLAGRDNTPARVLAQQIAELFAEGVDLRPDMAGLLNAYVAEAVA